MVRVRKPKVQAWEKATAPASVLAQKLKLTEARIRQLVSEEGFPKNGRGEYPIVPFLLHFIRFQAAQLERREMPHDMAALEKRKLELDVEAKQLKVDAEKGLLVPVSEYERMLSQVLGRIREKTQTFRGEFQHQIIGIPDLPAAREKLDEIGRAFLEALRLDLTDESSWADEEESE